MARRGIFGAINIGAVAFHDFLRSLLGLQPAYIKLVGQAGSLSFMLLTAEEETAYYSKHPQVYQVIIAEMR